jgi:hypothetical protein
MKKIAALSITILIALCALLYAIVYLLWGYKLSTGAQPVWHDDGPILLRDSREMARRSTITNRRSTIRASMIVATPRRILALQVRAQTSRKEESAFALEEKNFSGTRSRLYGGKHL